MTEQPEHPRPHAHILISVGTTTAKTRIRAWVTLGAAAALAGMGVTVALLFTRDMGLWPWIAGAFVLATAALARAALAILEYASHVEDTLRQVTLITFRQAQHHAAQGGTDPMEAIQGLIDEINTIQPEEPA